jgi:hypothetical protein
MTTTELSDSLERVDHIIKTPDEIRRGMAFQHYRNVAYLALCHARNLRKPGRRQRRSVVR